ncbi:porin family protein, partial [Candidatus Aminicenantes bacterium AC-334-E05]|nr:porin family protein [Candidatus Aminicenantes bacterium AC-334-E05]
DVYGNGGLIFGANFSYEILKKIDVWTSIKHFTQTGETTLLKEKVDFKLIPFSIGARYRVEVDEGLETYFGGGGDLYFYNEKGIDFETKDSEWGFHIQGGILAKISKRLFLDFNFKYTRVKSKPEEDLEINLGGVEGGISLLFLF